MIRNQIYLYIAACSSALLYSAAFVWLDACWFLVVLALGIVWWAIGARFLVFQFLTFWSAIVVFVHYLWVIPSLENKLALSLFQASLIYIVVALVHVICFIGFFWLMECVSPFVVKLHRLFFTMFFLLSFPVTGFMIMFIFDGEGCYNMLSPMIPLSKIFVYPGRKFDDNFKKNTICKNLLLGDKKISFFSLTNRLPVAILPWGRAQYLFRELHNLDGQSGVIATPESFFPFPLNRHPDMLGFITSALSSGQCLLLGGQYEQNDGKIFQATYIMTSQGIKEVYLKQHAVPCFERMPWYLQGVKKICQLFDAEQSFSCMQKKLGSCGVFYDGVRIVPRLCSDFFLVTSAVDLGKLRHRCGDRLVVVLQVNDTWFVGYMRALLRQVACMRAWLAGVNLVYIGYHDE